MTATQLTETAGDVGLSSWIGPARATTFRPEEVAREN